MTIDENGAPPGGTPSEGETPPREDDGIENQSWNDGIDFSSGDGYDDEDGKPPPDNVTVRGKKDDDPDPMTHELLTAIDRLSTGLALTTKKLKKLERLSLVDDYALPYQEASLATRALIDHTYGTPLRPLQTIKKQRAKLSELRQHPLTDLEGNGVKNMGVDPTKVLNFNKVRQPKPKFSDDDAYKIAQGIAIRQSNKFEHGWTLHEDEKTKTYPLETTLNGDAVTDPDAIVVGNVVVKLLDKPNTQPACEAKRFPFADRSSYDADQYDQFYKSATSYNVLKKEDKLAPITVSQSDHKILVSVRGLHQQIRLIRDHFSRHDVDTVFRNIIVPVDVKNSKKMHPYNFDLFEDWPKLVSAQVANSNAYYNLHTQKNVRDMLAITYECLRVNTDQKLWNTTVEEHDKFDAAQQGGPLMLFLILKRIHDVSDASLESLLKQIKAIKIHKIKGENVEEAISLINNGSKVLEQCSKAGGRNYIPQEFPKIVLDIMQTSTIPSFNQVFEDRQTQATTEADLVGGSPQYDSVTQTCNLALNTYKRMSAPGPGYCWAKKTKDNSAFSTNLRTKQFPEWQPGTCLNCCKPNCRPKNCKEEKNQVRINANYEKLKAHQKKQKDKAKRSTTTTTGSGGQEKPVFDEKGRPLKHNKHGKLVIDSAMLAKQKKEQGDKDTKTDSTQKDEPMVALTQSKEVQAALNEVDREAQSLQYSLPQESRAPAAAYMASVDTLKKLLTKR